MQGEHIDYGYTGTVAIPKEVKNMKNTILTLGGIKFTGKQFGLTLAACLLAFAVFKFFSAINLPTVAIVASVLVAAPLLVLAFVRKHGMEYDTWLLVKRANTKLSNPIRKNEGLNEYEKLEDLYDRAIKKEKHLKRRKKRRSTARTFL